MYSSQTKVTESSKSTTFGYGKTISSNGTQSMKSPNVINNTNIQQTTLSSISAATLESFNKKTPTTESPAEDKKSIFTNGESPSLLTQLELLSNRHQPENTPLKYPLMSPQFTSPNTTILALKEKEYLKIRQDHSVN